jgi:hypothetical protein
MITKERYNLELSKILEGAKGEHYVPSFGYFISKPLTPKGVTRLEALNTRNFVICNHSIHNYM